MENSYALSPVAVLGFNWPDRLKVTLSTLEQNTLADQSDLYVFIDGPRDNNAGEAEKVKEVMDVAKTAKGFRKIEICTSEKNKGLEKSIIGAVNTLMERYGKVIVVEDDLYLSPSFLEIIQ